MKETIKVRGKEVPLDVFFEWRDAKTRFDKYLIQVVNEMKTPYYIGKFKGDKYRIIHGYDCQEIVETPKDVKFKTVPR